MHDESLQEAGSRERVAQNVYRRRRKSGEWTYEATFRDTDRRQRRQRLRATNERGAINETRRLLAKRDEGDRVIPAAVTMREIGRAHV